MMPRSQTLLVVGGLALSLALTRRRTRWWLRQLWLRSMLVERDTISDVDSIRLVAGVDVSFVKSSDTDACAALVVCDMHDPELAVVYSAFRRVALTAPYVPGFLAFREVGLVNDETASK